MTDPEYLALALNAIKLYRVQYVGNYSVVYVSGDSFNSVNASELSRLYCESYCR